MKRFFRKRGQLPNPMDAVYTAQAAAGRWPEYDLDLAARLAKSNNRLPDTLRLTDEVATMIARVEAGIADYKEAMQELDAVDSEPTNEEIGRLLSRFGDIATLWNAIITDYTGLEERLDALSSELTPLQLRDRLNAPGGINELLEGAEKLLKSFSARGIDVTALAAEHLKLDTDAVRADGILPPHGSPAGAYKTLQELKLRVEEFSAKVKVLVVIIAEADASKDKVLRHYGSLEEKLNVRGDSEESSARGLLRDVCKEVLEWLDGPYDGTTKVDDLRAQVKGYIQALTKSINLIDGDTEQ